MFANQIPVPHLKMAHSGPLHRIEKIILNQVATIETWFRDKWRETPPSITSSVDLRHAGFKISPVDTNLFPAGFNNLNPDFLPLCVQAVQSILSDHYAGCRRILLLPENHTRNQYYWQSLSVLKDILVKAGFIVRLGSLDSELISPTEIKLEKETLIVEPLVRRNDRIGLQDFEPCVVLLNNDLSSGIPPILENLKQKINPPPKLGWDSRLKSSHFSFFDEVANEFASLVDLDPWFINPYFKSVQGVDFMAQEGLDNLASEADKLLAMIKDKYLSYDIKEEPFLAVKADNGTYGMSVMTINSADEILNLNRKQRTKMAASKGGRQVDKVMLQEGVYTFETMEDGSVAEPVVYMLGQFVVGGFYRVHEGKAKNENLNAPGMHFAPLAFAEACNMPRTDLDVIECPNRFYTYGVIARLAALAAAREMKALGE